MTRSRTKQSTDHGNAQELGLQLTAYCIPVPQEFTSVPFPVKALKIILHDVHSGGEAATFAPTDNEAYDVDSDDGVSV